MTDPRIDPVAHAPKLVVGSYDKISTKKVTDHLNKHVEQGAWERVSEYYTTSKNHRVRDFKSPTGLVWSAYEVQQRFGLDEQVILFYPKGEPLVGLIADVQWSPSVKFINTQRMDRDTIGVCLSDATPQDCVGVQQILDGMGVAFDLITQDLHQEAWSALQDQPGDLLVVAMDQGDERIYQSIFTKMGKSLHAEPMWVTDFKANQDRVRDTKRAIKVW